MYKDVFWAKKKRESGFYEWLPLRQHLKDVAYTIDRLWELWLDEGQKTVIEQSFYGEKIDTDPKKLIQFLALTHDLMKLSYVFQAGINSYIQTDLDSAILEKLECNGFPVNSQPIPLADARATPHAWAGQAALISFKVNEDIAAIVGSHHGRPVNKQEKRRVNSYLALYPRNFFQSEQKDEISEKWKSALQDLFSWALQEAGYAKVADLPHIKQNAQVILSGLLIMADWIASNEDYFPLLNIEQEVVQDPSSRMHDAWLRWWKSDQWTSESHTVDYFYQNRFHFPKARPVQEKFNQVVADTMNPGIFIFEAPMGLGKTEAALVAVEQLAYKCHKSGLFFGLPTQATSNGIFPRISHWLEKVAEEKFDVYSIRLSHGKAALNDDFNWLKNHGTIVNSINIDEEHNGSLLVNEWFSGRKTAALDDFVVGTVDQFLMIALKQKHLALRHLGFSKKVIVIDEVHAYDVYTSQYLQRAIQWAASYNVPIIILSATLPAAKRVELVQNYLIGKGIKRREILTNQLDLTTDAYPLITYSDGNEIKQYQEFEKAADKTVEIIQIYSEQIFELIERLSQSKGIVGLIVNTVKKAQELARCLAEIYGAENISLLHSAFIATDRIAKENELLNEIGNGKSRPDFKIIIGTQVIEQSLDIDFDVLISDLCPIDLLIQRIGRLHRHDIARPAMHQQPKLYVMGTDAELNFEIGSNSIYGGYLLTRSQYFLPDMIKIPGDISKLVQRVYSDFEISLPDKVKDVYSQYKVEYEDSIDYKKNRAKTYLLNKPSYLDSASLIGWLEDSDHTSWENNEEQGQNQVRDIQETIEVVALKQVGEGYGLFMDEADISSKIAEFDTAKEIAKNTLRLPLILSKPYNIDQTIRELEKYNLLHLQNWQDNIWLKGSLGIVFDENNEYSLNGYILKYNKKYGLSYERSNHGQI